MSAEEMCSECGQSVEIIAGHPRNWVRRMVATSKDLDDAIKRASRSIDEHNMDFVLKEFSRAVVERFGRT